MTTAARPTLRRALTDGVLYLQQVQHESSGGLPATQIGEADGCWTSASALESVLVCPFVVPRRDGTIRDLVSFLDASAIRSGSVVSWPVVAGSGRSSTMATGHALAALSAAQAELVDEPTQQRLAPLLEGAIQWITANVNDDGSWGVEPDRRPSGRPGRLISTAYALRGLSAAGQSVDNSDLVRNAVQWLWTSHNASDGGFGASPGAVSDPCSTARTLNALHRCAAVDPNDARVDQAVEYLRSSKPRGRLWDLETESYVSEETAGQTTFNSNTTADVLEALLRLSPTSKNVGLLVDWYLKHQMGDGSWPLGANEESDSSVVTWPTCEAILTLSIAEDIRPSDLEVIGLRRTNRVSRWLVVALVLALVAAVIGLVGSPSFVSDIWEEIPPGVRDWLRDAVVVALVTNLVAAAIWDWWFRRRRER